MRRPGSGSCRVLLGALRRAGKDVVRLSGCSRREHARVHDRRHQGGWTGDSGQSLEAEQVRPQGAGRRVQGDASDNSSLPL